MSSGSKTTAAAAAHARAKKKSAVPAGVIELNQKHQHQAGLAPDVTRDQLDRERLHAPRAPPVLQYLNKQQVTERVGFTYNTLWDWMRRGLFPRAFMIQGRLRWYQHEVEAWMEVQQRQTLKGDAA